MKKNYTSSGKCPSIKNASKNSRLDGKGQTSRVSKKAKV